ncbi:uncharacterized protein Dwil_GK12519 [Drosophila willistoni]|uniref:Protein ecdysoneless n=1 Tax=Drosophila willistoni TaxID=7260 RepID=B4N352_DROWI|nr:protein ecdysoneless [Drosophila willistoni]EDW78791.1 uncharacterized protein Dwil_GK12519 [Drosophila willistoni]
MSKTKTPGSNLEFVREDDYVEYYIFPKLTDNIKPDQLEQVKQQLEKIRSEILLLVNEKITERCYIWHKDEFNLQVRTGSHEERLLNDEINPEDDQEHEEVALLPHLHGVSHYGDNIGDEWFIVYLLAEITRSRADCIVRVCDSDGEFLLIEAADALPDWASPDTCEQRVYLVNGVLQLVQNSPSTSRTKRMPMSQAVERIRLNPTLYRCSKNIQNCIDMRLKEFQLAQPHFSIHQQIVELPQNAAGLLKMRPSLVSAAVRAFCDRDSLDSKALRSMRYFPPESKRVRTNVRFTRCLYAMLMHSQYTPERRLGWQLTDSLSQPERYKEQLLGVKLASGLEILASQAKSLGDNKDATSPAWRAYVRSLQSKGYFKDNLEGSSEYQQLLAKAKEYYQEQESRFRLAPRVGSEILELLHNKNDTISEDLLDDENNLQPSDSDNWLSITAEDLDTMLQERYGPKKLYNPNGDMNAEEFTKQLSEFLEQQSNFEGIESKGHEDHDLDSDDDDDDDEEEENVQSKRQSNNLKPVGGKVKKNPSMRKACQQRNSLIQSDDQSQGPDSTHVRNFLDFVIPEDNWDSNSEMSDYADEADLEHNFDALSNSASIQSYMDQMDRELAHTAVGKTFHSKKPTTTAAPSAHLDDDDDFDDIEDFEPININVNTLRNMMDSYKSQVGGSGPVSNLFSAMGVGMAAAAATTTANTDEPKDLSESAV